MSFKSGVKCRGSDRWCEWRWWLWWGDMCRMRWTRITVNRMRLMVIGHTWKQRSLHMEADSDEWLRWMQCAWRIGLNVFTAVEIDDELTTNSVVNHSSSTTGQLHEQTDGRPPGVETSVGRSARTHLSIASVNDWRLTDGHAAVQSRLRGGQKHGRTARLRVASVLWQIVCHGDVSWLVLFWMLTCCRVGVTCFEDRQTSCIYRHGQSCNRPAVGLLTQGRSRYSEMRIRFIW